MSLPKEFFQTAKICSIDRFAKENQGYLWVNQNKVLASHFPKGIIASNKKTGRGLETTIKVSRGTKISKPFFFCFGMLKEREQQVIVPKIILEEGSSLKIIAHCSFPRAFYNLHQMKGSFKIGKKSFFEYEEHHYHGETSELEVTPELEVEIEEEGIFWSNFLLTKGTVGRVQVSVKGILKKNSRIHIESKVLGKNKKDDVSIVDRVFLLGENSRSLIKMRAAARNGGKVFMQGETFAYAAGAIGHVDCQEIIFGKDSLAKAVPLVEVSHEKARITHEASVGRVNQKELETLLTRGLSEEEATDLIIDAMMRKN